MQKKLESLTIFFPFYNDAGTVQRQIENAFLTGKKVASEVEVIAIHGGNSKDDTFKKIQEMKAKFKDLVIIDKTDNSEGYAVIKHGFYHASKSWVFYTDGDAQYHIEEDLEKLVLKQLKTNADVVNGYKVNRGDNIFRKLLGRGYAKISKFAFQLKIRDTDCDFRLIRTSLFEKINLESTDASILPELIKKLELSGAKFAEVPVGHYSRIYGSSSYTAFSLFKEKIMGDLRLYFKLRKNS